MLNVKIVENMPTPFFIKQTTKDLLVFVFLPLLLGVFIYYYTRPHSIYFLSWIDDSILQSETTSKIQLPYWIIYHLPDGLWAFAFTSIVCIIWQKNTNRQNIGWLLTPVFISILIEIGYGTFDWVDLCFVIIGGILPFIVTQFLNFNYMNNKNNFRKALSLIAIAGFTLFAIASGDSESNGSSSRNSSLDSDSGAEKQWTTVYTFEGNGMKKSSTFELTGGEARLKYSYKSEGGIGMGMFSVYVVDEGKDIMKTGGFPEVMIQSENEESESTIQKNAGRYYLNVNAVGNWKITVEELK